MRVDCNSRDSGEQNKDDQDKESDGKSGYMSSDDVIALRWIDWPLRFMDMPDLVYCLALDVTDHLAGLIFDAWWRVRVRHSGAGCHFPVFGDDGAFQIAVRNNTTPGWKALTV